MLAGDTVTPGTRLPRCKREPPRLQEPLATSSQRHRLSRARGPGSSVLLCLAGQQKREPGDLAPLQGSQGLKDQGLWKLPYEAGGLRSGHSPRKGSQGTALSSQCPLPLLLRKSSLGRWSGPCLPSTFCDHGQGVESFHCPETGVTQRFNAGEGPGHT